MWPLDRPAREVLKLPGETAIAWAVFDAGWYRAAYPDVPNGDAAAALAYYLDVGQGLGHSPNRLFDETWHRQRYPGVAAGIAAGAYASAFDSYCRRGCGDRSAHWLFDELGYRRRYPDLTDEALESFEIANGYDHYLRHGVEEDRVGHPMFDPAVYLANFDPPDASGIRISGVFQHFLARIETREPELRASVYFDPDWYLRRYPAVAEAIKAGRWKCALHHYMCNDQPLEYDPNDAFSESFYLGKDPGLLEAIEAGHFRNGYAHFIRYGAKEMRQPCAMLDLRLYADQPNVAADLEQGIAPDAFVHWLRYGSRQGLARLAERSLTEQQARIPFREAALALLPIAGRFGYDFSGTDPICTVVIAARNGFSATMAAFAALRAATPLPIEPIVIDCGSSDETRALDRYARGVRLVRFQEDIGPVAAANAGWQLGTAPFVLFLAPDARLAPNALQHAVDRLSRDETVAAVAGLLVKPLGTVGSAGGIVWADGGLHRYQAGASPLAPEANFVRDVDFGSLACLVVRRSILETEGGLDTAFAPERAAADLGLRIARIGRRVVYDPSVLAFHDDSEMPADLPDAGFNERHAGALATRQARSGAAQAMARFAEPPARRLLFIDDTVPLRRLGSGFVRSNDLVRVIAELGCAVTVFPVNGCPHDPAHVFGDMPESVEVMHTQAADGLKSFLEGRKNYYDTIWVCRLHNLNRIRPALMQLRDAGDLSARIILDTEAVTPQREALRANLAGEIFDLDAAMRQFAAGVASCDAAVAVTDAEAAVLRDHGVHRVATIGHMIAPRPTSRPFKDRRGALFVGAVHTPASPNFDSLVWFVEEVLPRIETLIGWNTALAIAGYTAPSVDLQRFETHPRVQLLGAVADLQPLYDKARVFVAPTRFAAGAPYKVLEAASFGVPIVATTLLAEEVGWTDGAAMMAVPVGDAAGFAEAVVAVHENEDLWQRLRREALERVEAGYRAPDFISAVREVLSVGHP